MPDTPRNTNMNRAQMVQNDEFYTQLPDIDRELKHYKEHFKGKTVLCNCDDPRVSNFFHYFSYNFEFLGLKKLITTCYKNSDMDLFSQHDKEQAIYLEYNGDKNGNNIPDVEEIGVYPLKGDGDFRSQECIDILKQVDIVVTNPPFSLFRQYISQLLEYDKKFLVICNYNAVKYKEVFPCFKNNEVWCGVSPRSMEFKTPNDEIKTVNACWVTNLPHKKRKEDIILYKSYSPAEYKKYENFDAINVDKVSDIPHDYSGLMGVPITFMENYNPDQFEIIGVGIAKLGLEIGIEPYKPEHKKYRKEVQGRGAVDGDLYMMVDGEVTVPYTRIIIRNKRL